MTLAPPLQKAFESACPSTMLRMVPLPRCASLRGGRISQSVLAAHLSVRVLQPPSHEPSSFRIRFRQIKRGRRSAERRMPSTVRAAHPDVATRMAGRGSALSAARSPSGASPRHSPRRSQPALAQPQNRFPAAGRGAVFCPPRPFCRGLTRSAWTGPFAGRPVPQGRPGADRIHPRAGTAPRSVFRKCPRERRPR